MNTKFETEYYLRNTDFDRRGKILPSSVLDLFQESAGAHSEELGIGSSRMNAMQLLWVLVRVKYEILGEVLPHTTVQAKTWPLVPSRLGFQREYLITAADGTELIRGTSEWVLVHSEKRKIVAVKDVYPFSEGFETRKVFEEKTAKLHDFIPISAGITVTPGYSQLDTNGHVNNTKYANYIIDLLSPSENESIRLFQIDYHKEVLAGVSLSLFCNREENGALIKGVNETGEKMFTCKILFG